jgi:hypothetical protein
MNERPPVGRVPARQEEIAAGGSPQGTTDIYVKPWDLAHFQSSLRDDPTRGRTVVNHRVDPTYPAFSHATENNEASIPVA